MCGLTGFLGLNCFEHPDSVHGILMQMANAIFHRGPDGDGYWADPQTSIGLAHRRLAIVELSPAGAQPMASVSGRYVLAFNGEIYNHLRLRDALEHEGKVSANWRGHSDTETLLAGFDAWGIEGTLKEAIGMFAVAVWDRVDRVLTLARDRLGEKPLYYGWQGQGSGAVFLFGSELSALRRHPAFAAEVNRDALALHMRHNCIGGEHSIYSGIRKLLPGHLLSVSLARPEPQVRAWWSGANVAMRGVAEPFAGSPEQAVDELEALLCDAVAQQMMADVPLGAFLSGGIDSSTVVALMQAHIGPEMRAHLLINFGAVDIEIGTGIGMDYGKAQSHWRARHIASANIEKPSKRIERGNHHGIGIFGFQPSGDIAALFFRAFAGIYQRMHLKRRF